MTRLLVSVRGPNEAIAAARGGAHIADVEYPASALGTPYPLNIKSVRDRLDAEGFKEMPISTNIGEEQIVRSTACQASLGVALAGADYIKFGMAGLCLNAAEYLGDIVVRTVREWFPTKKVFPVVFPDEDLLRSFDPLQDGPKLVKAIKCDGLLIDTYHKGIGKGLLDYYKYAEIETFVKSMHALKKEAWVAGSVSADQLPELVATRVDVICVRGAACKQQQGLGRFGEVSTSIVEKLMSAMK